MLNSHSTRVQAQKKIPSEIVSCENVTAQKGPWLPLGVLSILRGSGSTAAQFYNLLLVKFFAILPCHWSIASLEDFALKITKTMFILFR
jgi:hypothetical protein